MHMPPALMLGGYSPTTEYAASIKVPYPDEIQSERSVNRAAFELDLRDWVDAGKLKNYLHIYVKFSALENNPGSAAIPVGLRINDDAGSNYLSGNYWRYNPTTATAALAGGQTTAAYATIGWINSLGAPAANAWSQYDITINNARFDPSKYGSSVTYKKTIMSYGCEPFSLTTAFYIYDASLEWTPPAFDKQIINKLKFFMPSSSNNFLLGSCCSVYLF